MLTGCAPGNPELQQTHHNLNYTSLLTTFDFCITGQFLALSAFGLLVRQQTEAKQPPTF